MYTGMFLHLGERNRNSTYRHLTNTTDHTYDHKHRQGNSLLVHCALHAIVVA